MPAQAGIQYAVMPREHIEVTEYWIIRWSLSSGGHSADPLADDDGWSDREALFAHFTRLNRTLFPSASRVAI